MKSSEIAVAIVDSCKDDVFASVASMQCQAIALEMKVLINKRRIVAASSGHRWHGNGRRLWLI